MICVNDVLSWKPKTKFQFGDDPRVVELDARNGLSYGPLAVILNANSRYEIRNGVKVYSDIELAYGEKHYDDNVGEYVEAPEMPKKKQVFAVDEKHMYYAEPYIRTTAKSQMLHGEPIFYFNQSEQVKYYDPNMRLIGDLEFYDKMVKLCREMQEREIKSINKALDEGKDDFKYQIYCYDFIEQFEGSKNPFEEGKKLTLEQREEFLSFTDAMLKNEFIREDYTYNPECYTLLDIAHKYVGKELQK